MAPDQNCYEAFCEGKGKKYCDNGQVRNLEIDEPESLGPYAARYFASKMWYGEQWFMQIDAHMTFIQDWDAISVKMLQAAPSKKPVISHYPPSHMSDLERMAKTPASRLCGPIFATSDLEAQIIRLEGASVSCNVILVNAGSVCTNWFSCYPLSFRDMILNELIYLDLLPSLLLVTSSPIRTFCGKSRLIHSCLGFLWEKRLSCQLGSGPMDTIFFLLLNLLWDIYM